MADAVVLRGKKLTVPDRDLLRIPRRDTLGQLLERCGIWRGFGAWPAKLQRLRRKHFLAELKTPRNELHVRNILRHEVGRDFEAALREWVRVKVGTVPSSQLESFPESINADTAHYRCSVIINTVDRGRELALTLHSLEAGWDSARDELIVVLGPTNDDSEVVLRDARLPCRLVRCPEKNLAVSRNLGLQAAAGRFVAFLDDDASPEAGWLDALLAPLEHDPRSGVSAGFVVDGEGRKFLNRHVVADTLGRARWFQDEASAQGEIDRLGTHRAFLTATGCNMAFRRDTLNRIGGFDPAYRYFLEETDVVWRLLLEGFRCVIAPQSTVRHRRASNLARQASFQIEDRLVLIRSQMHYIRKFGMTTFSASEIENCIWERALRDLERIAWDCRESPSVGMHCGDLQSSYLGTLAADLSLSTCSD